MVISILRLWPGAILTLFYLTIFLACANGEASNVLHSPRSQNGPANINLGKRAPPQYRPLAQPPTPHLRHRDPGVLGDLIANLGGGGKKGNANKAPTTVTVTKALVRNATVLMTAPATTVFVTMPAETITAMMMTTVTAEAPAPAPAPASAPAESNAPAPAAAEAPGTSTGAGTNPPGLVSALTLGFLSTQSTLATLAARAEVAVVTLSPMSTETSFGIATVTSTLFVANEDAVATGMASMATMGTEMKSEAVSGRQAGTRCMGFGAVVVAIWVAVLIL